MSKGSASYGLLLTCVVFLAPDRARALPPQPPIGHTWAPIPELTDEFNGTSLDATKWLPYQPYWSGRDSTFDTNNVYLTNGTLCLRSTATTLSDIRAACVTSITKQAVMGCYYEASIKTSRLSMTSSFWFQGNYSEIDVVEELGASVSNSWKNGYMFMNTHYFPNGWSSDSTTPCQWLMPTTCDSGFHTYGCWWKDTRNITFYHNDNPVQDITTAGDFNENMYLFFDTEVFSWEGWPTLVSLQDASLNTMYVDWVRSWQMVTQPPATLVWKLIPGGGFQLGFGGQYNLTYSVWTSADLGHWNYLGQAVENTNGVFVYTDLAGGDAPARFYQVRSP